MNKTLLLAGAACFLAFNASAAEINPYVGLDYNYSITNNAHNGDHGYANNFNSGSLVAGAKLSDNVALEAFYQRSDSKTDRLGNGMKTTRKFDAYGIDALGMMRVGCTDFDALVSAGIGEYDVKTKHVGLGSNEDKGTGYRLGLGAQYNLTSNIAIRGMYRHVFLTRNEVDDINEFSLGARYSF